MSLMLRGCVIALLVTTAGRAAGGWAQLRPGMSPDQASAVLGEALQASKGRGFEVAIYDHRAELVYFAGRLVTWTPPASEHTAQPPPNTWQFAQGVGIRLPTKLGAGPTWARPAPSPLRGAILPAYRL